ncbi:MAG: sensor histidine kinase [Solirubrobacterales bacterium]|nr:sensor histidine kinase [Solirubrobacterales bacterium]
MKPAASLAGSGLDAVALAKLLAYLACGLLLGGLYLAAIVSSVVLGALLGVFWIGLLVLIGSSTLLWHCASLERRLANVLLDARIPVLPPLAGVRGGTIWQRVLRRLRRGPVWRGALLLGLRLPASALAMAAIASGGAVTVLLVVYGVRGLAGSDAGYVGPFSLGPASGIALCLLAAPVAVLTVAVTDLSRRAMRSLARSMLITSLAAHAPVREALAESLGDRTLSIAYWLPDRETFVDEAGIPVPLPEPGSDRAWTAVDYEGRRVAAILHAAHLEASPELVQAAAAAASLALDNERLKADLRARVEELSASRVRIVEASNAARRKVERDLHDGAQQQLVALALELKVLRGRVGSNDGALQLIDGIESKLSAALDELRALGRGIHPGILTDRGLAAALEALVTRAPLPVAREIDLPERPPPAVEAVGYYVVTEALTNVLKYAEATEATVRARYEGGDVLVELQDDGVGGAEAGRGSGLQGLRDRVAALDGELTVISPPGAGTLVRARVPRHPARLVSDAGAEPA